MSWRTVIVDSQSKLDYKLGYMVVRGTETRRVHIDEIETLVIENPAVSFTGYLIEALVEKKVKVIFCDSRHDPVAELIPHHGCHDCTLKIRNQIMWAHETKALVWMDIVSEKIRRQAELLNEAGMTREADLLCSYIKQVEPMDATNREGHAAKVYFNALFGMDFTRGADIPVNAALNYGYSLVLSSFNREIAANGYLTQLGIFHNNMFNPFNLASDLMEPFRIIADRIVFCNIPEKFGKDEKHAMWRLLEQTVLIDGRRQSVSNAIRIYTRSILDALNEGDPSLIMYYTV